MLQNVPRLLRMLCQKKSPNISSWNSHHRQFFFFSRTFGSLCLVSPRPPFNASIQNDELMISSVPLRCSVPRPLLGGMRSHRCLDDYFQVSILRRITFNTLQWNIPEIIWRNKEMVSFCPRRCLGSDYYSSLVLFCTFNEVPTIQSRHWGIVFGFCPPFHSIIRLWFLSSISYPGLKGRRISVLHDLSLFLF